MFFRRRPQKQQKKIELTKEQKEVIMLARLKAKLKRAKR